MFVLMTLVSIFLTLSQTTNFRFNQTERVCRRQFQIWWIWQKVLRMGRKPSGKRRNCSSRAISPFPTVFSKVSSSRHVKTRDSLGKGYAKIYKMKPFYDSNLHNLVISIYSSSLPVALLSDAPGRRLSLAEQTGIRTNNLYWPETSCCRVL